MDTPRPLQDLGWLVRIPAVFAGLEAEILAGLTEHQPARLGKEYHWLRSGMVETLRVASAFRLVSWNLPVHHAWPCCPQQTDQFVEKAAQAVVRKFAGYRPQAMLAGPLHAGAAHPYYRRLAANLRGRIVQLWPALAESPAPEDQDPQRNSLFCLVGKEGLYGGLHTPRAANGFFPGGTRFIRQQGAANVSRAGAKLAEALHYLPLHHPLPPAATRWLELGASPGGMTAELLERGYQVTAVDRAPLDARLTGKPGLTFAQADAASWHPPAGSSFGAILCDLNGDARAAIRLVARHARHLVAGGIVVFTLKLAGADTLAEIDALHREVLALAAGGGLVVLASTHLTYNRREFTVFFTRA